MSSLKNIYLYPVKGLSGQPLTSINLAEGKPLPHDRRFALARPGVPLETDNPKWAKKGLFVMLMLDEALAKVQTHLDPETLQFEVHAGNRIIISVNLNEPDAKATVEDYFHHLVPTLPAPPMLVRSKDGHILPRRILRKPSAKRVLDGEIPRSIRPHRIHMPDATRQGRQSSG